MMSFYLPTRDSNIKSPVTKLQFQILLGKFRTRGQDVVLQVHDQEALKNLYSSSKNQVYLELRDLVLKHGEIFVKWSE